MYGVDTGIVATTIAHDSFKLYMYNTLNVPSELTGAIVSCYYAGNCIGSFGSGFLMDRWGRKSLVYLSTILAIVGTAIQAGSINVGMMIAGRAIAGLATGALLTIVPLYIAELAPPEKRAYLVALKGLLTAAGYLVANWIGYAGSFAQGDVQWRIPLAMQLPPAMVLLGLTVFLPDSPRWRKLQFHDHVRDEANTHSRQSYPRSAMKTPTGSSRPSTRAAAPTTSSARCPTSASSSPSRRRAAGPPAGASSSPSGTRGGSSSPSSS